MRLAARGTISEHIARASFGSTSVLERVSHKRSLRCPIDMYSATHSDATGGSVISLPFYPSEDPSRREHDDWLGSSRSILVRGNYSAAMSGSIPHWLLSLRQQSTVDDVPALTAEQQEASSPIDVIKHARLVDDAALKKATSKLAFEAGLREYHVTNWLLSWMRPCARTVA